jgi:TRAP-type C4-dicarboxylate transport system permease small subunit
MGSIKLGVIIAVVLTVVAGLAIGWLAAMGVNNAVPSGSPYLGLVAGLFAGVIAASSVFGVAVFIPIAMAFFGGDSSQKKRHF